MFRLSESHHVKWPVTVRKPIDNGRTEKHKLVVVYDIIPNDEFERASKDGADFLYRVLVGVETPIYGETSDDPVEFTEQVKQSFLRIPYVRAALAEGYFQASSGREAQQKN